jgi:hypothetical protein
MHVVMHVVIQQTLASVPAVLDLQTASILLSLLRVGFPGHVGNGGAHIFVGLARTIYIQCVYGIFGREITKYTVIYGVFIIFIRFWPTLHICRVGPTVHGISLHFIYTVFSYVRSGPTLYVCSIRFCSSR